METMNFIIFLRRVFLWLHHPGHLGKRCFNLKFRCCSNIYQNTAIFKKTIFPFSQVLLKSINQPWLGGSVGWSIVLCNKGCGFDSWSGHIPTLWVGSPVGACTGGNQLMFLSYTDGPLFLSLSLPPTSSEHISSGRIKKQSTYHICKPDTKVCCVP